MIKLIYTFLFFVTKNTILERHYKLKSISQDFQEAKNIFENPNLFYNELILLEDNESSVFCSILEKYNLENKSLKTYFYLSAAAQKLQCPIEIPLADEIALKEIASNNFASYFYSLNILKFSKIDITSYCKQLTDFYVSKGKFSLFTTKQSPSYYYTAIVTEIIQDCENLTTDGSLTLMKLLKEVFKEIEEIGSDVAILKSNSQTFFTTIRFLNLFLENPTSISNPSLISKMIRFVDEHFPVTLDNSLKAEHNRLLLALRTVDVITFSSFLNLENCEEKCKIVLQPPRFRRVNFNIGGEKKEFQSNPDGEFLLDKKDLENISYITLEAVDDNNIYYFPNRKIQFVQNNKISKIRIGIEDSPRNKDLTVLMQKRCETIDLEATQDDFLNLAFELRFKKNFIFVQLWPIGEQEKSTPVLAKYDEKSGLYFVTIDFGDYEVIRPNSARYSIIIFDNEVRTTENAPTSIFYCGKISVLFKYNQVTTKSLPSDSPIIEEQIYRYGDVSRTPSALTIFYFILIICSFYGLYLSIVGKYFWDFSKTSNTWEVLLLFNAFLILFHTIYLSTQRLLMEKVWIIIIEAILFSFITTKVFST